MKRAFIVILTVLLCCGILAGCSGTQNEEKLPSVQSPVTPSGSAIDNIPDAQPDTATPPAAQADGGAKEETPPPVQSPASSPESAVPSDRVADTLLDAQPDDTTQSDAQANGGIVDLTQLSSTMVYAEVYNMMMTPEDYIGKTIKMNGLYYASPNPELGIYYHFVIIQDATACCAQGLEFILKGEHTYPDDYPADETLIEVTGVWGTYKENGNTYYYIATDGIAVL